MSLINYPFYCVDKLDTHKAFDFLVKHPLDKKYGSSYGWVISYINHRPGVFSYCFFIGKMYVFSIIVSKGFRI